MAIRSGLLATRVSALAALVTVAWLVTAGAATAHVTVTAPGVSVGASDAAITIQVPTESDTASTVGLRLQLPTATPLAGVLVAPLPGWSAKITQTKLASPIHTDDGDITEVASEIDWSAAAGSGIKPGFFGEFTIIAGKLPDKVTTLTFKAIQTYSDGKVVSWIQTPAPGSSAEPDFPAPTLDLTAAAAATSATKATAPTVTAQPAASKDAASKGAATTGIVLGGIGAVLGAVALALVITRGRGVRG